MSLQRIKLGGGRVRTSWVVAIETRRSASMVNDASGLSCCRPMTYHPTLKSAMQLLPVAAARVHPASWGRLAMQGR